MPTEVTPWYAVERTKGVIQLVAVSAGVFIGWSLNGLRESRSRGKQGRAEWAAAAEEYLGALEALVASQSRDIIHGDPAYGQLVADAVARERSRHEAMALFRAATVRLAIVDAKVASEVRMMEQQIDALRDHDGRPTKVKIREARTHLRAIVERWTDSSNKDPGNYAGTSASAPGPKSEGS